MTNMTNDNVGADIIRPKPSDNYVLLRLRRAGALLLPFFAAIPVFGGSRSPALHGLDWALVDYQIT